MRQQLLFYVRVRDAITTPIKHIPTIRIRLRAHFEDASYPELALVPPLSHRRHGPFDRGDDEGDGVEVGEGVLI